MAYARLIFSNTATVQQKLKDIAKVCTGAATAVNQLEFAIQSDSEIVSIEPAGWTMADAASALEANGTATINEYRLQSPCVNPGKIKYCALSAYASENVVTTARHTINNSRPGAAATTGFMWIPIGTGVSANTLTNAVWFYGSATQNFHTGSTVNNYGYNSIRLSTSTTEYYISVSNRKLLVYAVSGTNGSSMIMNLEFPETAHTTNWNNLPVINVSFSNPTAGVSHGSVSVNLNNMSAGETSVFNYTFQRTAWFTDWYSLATASRASRSADDCLLTHYIPSTPGMGVNSNGIPNYPLVPIVDVRTSRGEGVHNYSSLTDVYYTWRTGNYLTAGDEFLSGNDTYVFLSRIRNIAIKKA